MTDTFYYNRPSQPEKSKSIASTILRILARFFKGLWFIFKTYLITIGLITTFMFVASVIAIKHLSSSKMLQKQTSSIGQDPFVLTMTLEGSIAESEPSSYEQVLQKIFGEEPSLYLPHLRTTMKKAASDARVKGLHIYFYDLEGSWAECVELRQILQIFKDSGKPLYIYLVSGDNLNYFLASVADHISHAPTGGFHIPGPTFQLTYFGKALHDLGIDVEVVRQGKYKSAVEPFIRNSPSNESAEMYSAMEESLRSYLVNTVAEGRKIPVEKMREWFNVGIITSESALKERLVDSLGYLDDHVTALTDAVQTDNKVEFDDYDQEENSNSLLLTAAIKSESKDSIALIEAIGDIVVSSNAKGPMSHQKDQNITPLQLAKELTWAADEDDVKAVVLRISSPGGSAVASDLIWEEVRKLAEVKPIVVSVGEYAASGGYYIAAPATKIIAEPTSIVGSIGAFGLNISCEACEKKYGVSFHMITGSARKKLLNFGEKSSANDITLLEGSLEEVYRLFVSKVAEGRKMSVSDIEKIAEGRVYTGLQANKIGLVDELGGLWDAFQAAKSLAGLDVNKLYPILRYPEEEFPLDLSFVLPFNGLHMNGLYLKSFLSSLFYGSSDSLNDLLMNRMIKWQQVISDEHILTLWPESLFTRSLH